MRPLANICKEIHARYHPKSSSCPYQVKTWSEKDVLDKDIVDAFVLILQTRGCSWMQQSGCSMCGYFTDSALKEVSDEALLTQIENAVEKYSDQPIIKIFNSGSFLDESEISKQAQIQIIKRLSKLSAKKIAVESRPQYITKEPLIQIKKNLSPQRFEIGIGLESSNDFIRTHAINKGFSFATYKKATKMVHDQNMSVKTYVLIKPPFLTEQEAIDDSIHTIHDIADFTDVISLNPTNVQRYTVVEYLWKRQHYRPPWLWSVKEILTQGITQYPHLRFQCDIVGGGKPRGAHNCPNCDKQLLEQIHRVSLSQSLNDFYEIDCSCKRLWEDQLNLEHLSFGSLVDAQRWMPL